jgi:hypothetical protein
MKDERIRSAVHLGEFSINKTDSEEISNTMIYKHNHFLCRNYLYTTDRFLNHQANIPAYDQVPHFRDENRVKYSIERTLKRIKAKAIKTKLLKYTTFELDNDGYCLINNSAVDSSYVYNLLKEDRRW